MARLKQDSASETEHTVIEWSGDAITWAKRYDVKLAFGSELMFDPNQMTRQNPDILELSQWFTSAEALKLVTHDNAKLLALSGPRNPYPDELGVVEEAPWSTCYWLMATR